MHALQLTPLLQYTWDFSTTQNVGQLAGMDLVSTASVRISPSSGCKDGQCMRLVSGSFFRVPVFDFGSQPGLSFSVWFKPASGAGPTARIFEFGGNSGAMAVGMARSSMSAKLEFFVRHTAADVSVFTADDGTWQTGVWKHVTWSIMRISTVDNTASWKIYIDGNISATVDGKYPLSGSYDQAYIGRAVTDTDGLYAGYLDSFLVFSRDLFDQEARIVYRVSWTRRLEQPRSHALIASLYM